MRGRLRTTRILLVEDNPGDANLVLEVFAEGNVTAAIDHVEDGVEAMAFLRRQGRHENAKRPDLVLLDLNLPRKDGRWVLKEMKADSNLRSIPVIVLTTSEAETDINEAYQNGVNCYLTKPIDFDDFIKLVQVLKDFWLTAAKLATPA